MSNYTHYFREIFLPVLLNLACGLILIFPKKLTTFGKLLVLFFITIFIVLILWYNTSHELIIVPKLIGKSSHEAFETCKKYRLKPVIVPGNYSPNDEAGKVYYQNMPYGVEVYVGTEIYYKVYLGEFGDWINPESGRKK